MCFLLETDPIPSPGLPFWQMQSVRIADPIVPLLLPTPNLSPPGMSPKNDSPFTRFQSRAHPCLPLLSLMKFDTPTRPHGMGYARFQIQFLTCEVPSSFARTCSYLPSSATPFFFASVYPLFKVPAGGFPRVFKCRPGPL